MYVYVYVYVYVYGRNKGFNNTRTWCQVSPSEWKVSPYRQVYIKYTSKYQLSHTDRQTSLYILVSGLITDRQSIYILVSGLITDRQSIYILVSGLITDSLYTTWCQVALQTDSLYTFWCLISLQTVYIHPGVRSHYKLSSTFSISNYYDCPLPLNGFEGTSWMCSICQSVGLLLSLGWSEPCDLYMVRLYMVS